MAKRNDKANIISEPVTDFNEVLKRLGITDEDMALIREMLYGVRKEKSALCVPSSPKKTNRKSL